MYNHPTNNSDKAFTQIKRKNGSLLEKHKGTKNKRSESYVPSSRDDFCKCLALLTIAMLGCSPQKLGACLTLQSL
jgi:hypothetical protein